jgi:hypothetical protein
MNFQQIYSEAVAAGRAAVEKAQVAPMIVGSEKGFLSGEIDRSKPMYFVEGGPCGFAWVSVKPANSAFANWLKKQGLARPDSYEGGVKIWVSQYGQSLQRKEAYANAMAESLRNAGIARAYAGSRMD